MVNLETFNTYEGAHDIHALILGRAITGNRGVPKLSCQHGPVLRPSAENENGALLRMP